MGNTFILLTYISADNQSAMLASTELILYSDSQTNFPSAITGLSMPSFPNIETARTTFVLSVYLVMSALSLPGNLLTIIVLGYAKKICQKTINMILSHQAFADLMVGVAVLIEEILDTLAYMDTVPFVSLLHLEDCLRDWHHDVFL